MGSDVFELKGNKALYEVLGVSTTTTDVDIRRAYYRLAVVYHPDKNPEGAEIFKEISFAYGILSDPAQRRLYDQQKLRTHIETQAREYDPMMDPNVELSAEDLRRFVERMRREEETKKKTLDNFEQRREEEMRRRAEYDARNPTFKIEYERQRAAAREAATCRSGGASTALPTASQPTTAEMMQRLAEKQAEEEENKNKNFTVDSASVRQNMMQEFRVRHHGEVVAPHTVVGHQNAPELSERLGFVAEARQKKVYSDNVEQRIQRSANFDYREHVEKGIIDGGSAVDDAILADALGLYDRRR